VTLRNLSLPSMSHCVSLSVVLLLVFIMTVVVAQ
jgi:hypothetical protein